MYSPGSWYVSTRTPGMLEQFIMLCTCVALPTKKADIAPSPDSKAKGSTSAAFFSEDIWFSVY